MRATPILPKKLLIRLSSPSFWHTKSQNNQMNQESLWGKLLTNAVLFFYLSFLPVSAKAAKGSDSLSLLSDSSAMAMRPLIRSTWLGCWLDWQTDLKTSPIRLQSSCLVQSWQTENIKAGPKTVTDWTQNHFILGRVEKSNLLKRRTLPLFPQWHGPNSGTLKRMHWEITFYNKES